MSLAFAPGADVIEIISKIKIPSNINSHLSVNSSDELLILWCISGVHYVTEKKNLLVNFAPAGSERRIDLITYKQHNKRMKLQNLLLTHFLD